LRASGVESGDAEMPDGASVHPVYGRGIRVRYGSPLWRLLSEAPAGSIIAALPTSDRYRRSRMTPRWRVPSALFIVSRCLLAR